MAVADVPGEDPVALVLVGRLRERAPARHAASAHVEPIAADSPGWDLGHRLLLRVGIGSHSILPPRGNGINGDWGPASLLAASRRLPAPSAQLARQGGALAVRAIPQPVEGDPDDV